MSDSKKVKPQNPKGTRDFLPQQVARRNFIFSTIKSVFRKYGFEEIETPALERLETLTGKYGDEGDKLLFKILNSGDYLKPLNSSKQRLPGRMRNKFSHVLTFREFLLESLNEGDTNDVSSELISEISERGLRYDLTVPLARYVVQHQNDIVFPFRRYHIGPVWRADKPQKGRYQEFYQCDADIIGSTSLINEVELTKIYVDAFKTLGLDVTIKINHRDILAGFALRSGVNVPQFTTVLDKIDKIGLHGVLLELKAADYPIDFLYLLENVLNTKGDAAINLLESIFLGPDKPFDFIVNDSLEGLNQVKKLLSLTEANNVNYDFSLARGLNYYTGIIWEVSANGVQMGSIGGGGRYDNLTEMFGGTNMSGVGISFGIERIYDVMEELNLFPENIAQGVTILFVPRDASNEEYAFKLATIARTEGISAEVFLGKAKKNKHFGYAATKGIHYMVEVGDNEQQSRHFRLRNVVEHKEEGAGFSLEELIKFLQR